MVPVQAANPFAAAAKRPTPSATAAVPSAFSAPAQQPNPFSQPQASQPQTQAASPFAQAVRPVAQPGINPVTGKPIDPRDRYKEGKPDEYEGDQGKRLEEIYKRVAQMGLFDDNEEIPLIPPKCEWIVPI